MAHSSSLIRIIKHKLVQNRASMAITSKEIRKTDFLSRGYETKKA